LVPFGTGTRMVRHTIGHRLVTGLTKVWFFKIGWIISGTPFGTLTGFKLD